MKIIVSIKRVLDTDQKCAVAGSGKSVVDEERNYVINPFDAIALEEAASIRESSDTDLEIVVVGIGADDYEKELRTALAVGADRAILVTSDAPLDPWNVSAVLDAVVKKEAPDIVIMGKQAVDDDSNQTGQFLAARLAWPQATFASEVSLEKGKLLVKRESDQGVETISVSLPAIVTCDLRLNEPRYASLPAIMKARRKPIDSVSIDELGVIVEPKVEVLSMEAVSAGRECQFVESVDELITKLRDEAKVLS
jgi:electron transfer flavoprotein beta subunit